MGASVDEELALATARASEATPGLAAEAAGDTEAEAGVEAIDFAVPEAAEAG